MLLVSEENEVLTVHCAPMGDLKTGQCDQGHEPAKREENTSYSVLQCY